MILIALQVACLATYLGTMVLVRQASREKLRRRADEERERRAALEREWKVGIPYDPSPDAGSRERRW